jgi:hypothetical protein
MAQMEALLGFISDYLKTVLFSWYGIVLAITGLVDLYERIFDKKARIPGRVRTFALVSIFLVAQIFAYRELQQKYDISSAENAALTKENTELVKEKTELLTKLSNQESQVTALQKQLKDQPKVVYREAAKMPSPTDSANRHLTTVQVKRLTRMFSELETKGVTVIVKTIADNQEALQYATEINSTLNAGRNTDSYLQRGMLWKKIPEGILICTHSDTNPQINSVAQRIAGEMIALGIAVILNENSSFPKNTVTILVGAKAID